MTKSKDTLNQCLIQYGRADNPMNNQVGIGLGTENSLWEKTD